MAAIPLRKRPDKGLKSPDEILVKLGVNIKDKEKLAQTLPFGADDATCGVENELQALVVGKKENVDLPLTICQSGYFQNLFKRIKSGELKNASISDLTSWLNENKEEVWDNSWVRIDPAILSPMAKRVLEEDFLLDKTDPGKGKRSDVKRFLTRVSGKEILRIPISYLLKLSLADSVGSQRDLPDLLIDISTKFMNHYSSDNTSPELFSFHTVCLNKERGMGLEVANETVRRFLLTQLLVQYAEKALGLNETGQKVRVHFSPQPPLRQLTLSENIPDTFYRELYMNPCLSGWDKGEEKHRYMHLCHEVLSRAQFNSLNRLKDAGVITNNLVVMPSASNISLANNGTHISLGSKMLGAALSDPKSGIRQSHEKYLGDLVIKISEHFLPLFVGNYSAAPYRLSFGDFQPEKLLTFLPYQLDYTHLRMIWRRWKKKATLKNRFLGIRFTPFGPCWLDEPLSRIMGLKGDFLPDFRLLNYLVAIMSTHNSPALDGNEGNQERLKADLAQMGVFHPKMPVYMAIRQRIFSQMGYSGFEGRHFSLFESFEKDLSKACDLQTLLTALAYKLIALAEVTHAHIPDEPEIESERRQIFFGAAIGLPTFFVYKDTKNLFMKKILEKTSNIRFSKRYPGYLRVKQKEYQLALLAFICEQGADIIESMGLRETMGDLASRLEHPKHRSALGRLNKGISGLLNVENPLDTTARNYNLVAESYYQNDLCQKHLKEAWQVFEKDFSSGNFLEKPLDSSFIKAFIKCMSMENPLDFIQNMRRKILSRKATSKEIVKLIDLLLLDIYHQKNTSEKNVFASKGQGTEHNEKIA